MGNLDNFKTFVKKNPKLLKHIKSGDMSWQKFYEIYDIYGEEESAWKDYLTPDVATKAAAAATGAVGFADLMNWVKTLDLGSIQSGIGNVQRVLGLVQDLSSKDPKKPKEEYKPRPLYKHFED